MNISVPDPRSPVAENHTPVLPHAGVIEVSADHLDDANIVGFRSHDERARAFNLLRTQIIRELESGGRQIIGITSPTPAAGKSFLSLNLAAAFSRITNRAVVLCDLDLRRGSVLAELGASVPNDVAGFLRGEFADWGNALYRIGETDLYVLPCEGAPRGSAELLSADTFETLMEGLRTLPPEVIVLCDLPPVFASDDALIIGGSLDSYLLVVEYGRNNATQVRETIRLLDPLPCLGTVLNRYRGGFFDSYGYGYGDPYGIKNYGAQG